VVNYVRSKGARAAPLGEAGSMRQPGADVGVQPIVLPRLRHRASPRRAAAPSPRLLLHVLTTMFLANSLLAALTLRSRRPLTRW